MPLLEAKGVTKKFGGLVAVNNLDFTMEPKSIVRTRFLAWASAALTRTSACLPT